MLCQFKIVLKKENQMVDLDLAYMPATTLVQLIKKRQISPVEVVQNCLERIEEVNSRLNCFCFTYPEEAMEKARVAESAVAKGQALGPLHGIPMAFKDLTPTKGKTTTRGSYIYEHWVPDFNAAIVDKFEAAGAIIVGKTTTPEFAYDGFTHSPLWGQTRNPWNPEHTPGGSSGGSGAAVAAGCVTLAEGSDMGGSVRIPASFCGIFGLKPSLGRIPMDILPSIFDNISHFGPLARTIDDVALFMRIAQGPDERDIQSIVTPQDFRAPVPDDLTGFNFAFSMDLGHLAIDDEVQVLIKDALEKLRKAGADITEVELDWPAELQDVWSDYWKVFMAAYFGHHLDTWRERMDPNVVELIEAGMAIRAVDYKRLEIARTKAWFKLNAILTRFQGLLCPVMTMAAPKVGATYLDFYKIDDQGKYHGMDLTAVFNLVGQCPALSVPAGFNQEELPVGLQVIGQRYDDYGTLCMGAAIDRVLGFSNRRPPF
jgi:Asp-tRNA(Asn)/Glu-tRNA(Gln) amidotransferase A subunit family amidase